MKKEASDFVVMERGRRPEACGQILPYLISDSSAAAAAPSNSISLVRFIGVGWRYTNDRKEGVCPRLYDTDKTHGCNPISKA